MNAKDIRINRRIRAREIRLIDEEGTQLGIVQIEDALALAEKRGLDLVEISPNSNPPVCRVMDYGKFKYMQKKKQSEARKKQTTIIVKEVKFRPKTDEHDFSFKLRHIRRFLEAGNKVKVTVIFRGRELSHKDIGFKVLARVRDEIGDDAVVEAAARMEGRQMLMMLAPKTIR